MVLLGIVWGTSWVQTSLPKVHFLVPQRRSHLRGPQLLPSWLDESTDGALPCTSTFGVLGTSLMLPCHWTSLVQVAFHTTALPISRSIRDHGYPSTPWEGQRRPLPRRPRGRRHMSHHLWQQYTLAPWPKAHLRFCLCWRMSSHQTSHLFQDLSIGIHVPQIETWRSIVRPWTWALLPNV